MTKVILRSLGLCLSRWGSAVRKTRSYMLLPQFGSCLLAEHAPRVRESMFLCYGALLPLILLLLMSSSALLPVLAASVKSAKISADGSKQKTPTHLSFFVQKTLAVTMVPVAIIESLMVKRKSLFWIVLTFAVANSPVEATCSTCFGYSVG